MFNKIKNIKNYLCRKYFKIALCTFVYASREYNKLQRIANF